MKNSETIAAFDYEKQEWLFGEPARQLLLSQLRDEKSLLESPQGAEYLRFNGCKETVEQALAKINAEIAALTV